MSGNIPTHLQPSLSALPTHLQTDSQLAAHLASRFHISLPTARLASEGLICLNTYTSSTRGPNGDKEGSAAGEAEELARRAYTRLGLRGEDQAVVFLGESGAGKTTVRSHLLSSLLSFSSTPLSAKLSLAAFVFDTLTSTKSLTTPTASKAGLFLELQYDGSSSPSLLGGKLLEHRLERKRLSSVPIGERSFHILYYLLAGTSGAEKKHLGLEHATHIQTSGSGLARSASVVQKRWRYLGHPTQMKVGINDAEGFNHFKNALRKLEFPIDEIAEICQVLAAILHIGQLDFITGQSTLAGAEDSGGYSHDGSESITTVRNPEVLILIAAFLGLNAHDLEESLRYKTKTIHRERVTVMLDPIGARENADELATTLYALLVAYIVESINQRLCVPDETVANTISIVDFPGFAPCTGTGSSLDQLLNNAANESLYNICLNNFFECRDERLESEDIKVPPTNYFDNGDTIRGLLKHGNGLLSIIDDQTRKGRSDAQLLESLRRRFEHKNSGIAVGIHSIQPFGNQFPTPNHAATFSVRHFAGEIDYPVHGIIEENGDVVSGDLMNLMKDTKSDFVASLFGQEALNTIVHPQEQTAIVQAQVSSMPTRTPSVIKRSLARGRRVDDMPLVNESGYDNMEEKRLPLDKTHLRRTQSKVAKLSQGAASQFLASLDNIKQSLTNADVNPYFAFCLKSNDRRIASQLDSKCVRLQLQTFGIVEISQRLQQADFTVFLPFGEFLTSAQADSSLLGTEAEKAHTVLEQRQWPSNEARVGTTGVFLSEGCWASLADLDKLEFAGQRGPRVDGISPPGTPSKQNPFRDSMAHLPLPEVSGYGYRDHPSAGGYFPGKELDTRSEAGASAFLAGDMFRNLETKEELAEKGNRKEMEEVDVVPTTGSRKRWLFLVYMMTWFIPDFLIKWIGGLKRKDVRTAWREKLAINLLIWLSCGFVVFFIVIFPQIICPKQYVYSASELSSHDGKGSDSAYLAIRGEVFDLAAFIPSHYPSIVPSTMLNKYAGLDATGLFPIQVSAVCQGKNGQIDPSVQLDYTSTNTSGSATLISAADPNRKYHDFRAFTNDSRPDWFTEQMIMLRSNYKKGDIGYSPSYVQTLSTKQKSIAILNGKIYDFTSYIAGGRTTKAPAGQKVPTGVDTDFMSDEVVSLFQQRSGQDVTQYWNDLRLPGDQKAWMMVCMDNLFYVGKTDTRNSMQCLFARYILLAISILMVSVIGFKFFAALNFSTQNTPETLDKFIICQVPAYTEDEESLRRAIDSAARMKYDDKRKLLVIICDGMIIGQGNDRPTPRIVLDILGVSDTVDPEPLSFESLGEGQKQHNVGKIYSGLYEVQGHIVPFLVLVKIGKPSEVTRPGNRGKRDSQMILMRFLNRVHYNLPMSPLELEMHHQIRNIIGVNPTFYEFMLQIDADTVVAPDSATRMVSAFIHDTRLIGVCGETSLTNAKSSFITMMQVYEYYISHNLTKAFESLFGSVTCLPGCFSMYRIRSAESGKPLFVSREIIEAYSEIRVDTLHMKNLLHLGEDRFLTTLLLKYHNKYKTKYINSAHAWTIAPDNWKVFMSQRRRWINSTVHNLMELIPLQQLCGFCCFSMRFVVFLDLLSTIVAPVTVAYIVYLIVLLSLQSSIVPLTSFILLGAIYGLQAIIFILRRKWEMIGWMIVYILAMPIFSFGLPLYAFWHMDDFTWGNTRLVTGERGKQIVISDEGKFDPASIPKKRWEEYQSELWEAQTQRGDLHNDTRSEVSGYTYATKSIHPSMTMRPASHVTPMYDMRPMSQMSNHYPRHNVSPSPRQHLLHSNTASPVHFQATDSLLQHQGNHSRPQSTVLPPLPPPPPFPRHASYITSTSEHELSEVNPPSYSHPPAQSLLLPTDDQLLHEIRDILSQADLMTVTKRGVKDELERRFGLPVNALGARRGFVNSGKFLYR